MRQTWRAPALCLAVIGLSLASVVAQQPVAVTPELKIGDVAPDFTLQASDGLTHSLSKLRGKTVVLGWFPKAFTAG